MADRQNLEWLVYHTLQGNLPCITISRGRELLGYEYMEDMRDWYRDFESKYKGGNV